MNLFVVTFESVAILLGIGLIGFWIIRKKVLPENALRVLSPLALEIALPSLVFMRIISDFSPSDSPDWWHLPIWWLFFMVVAALLTFIFRYISKKETRNEFAISLFFQNGIFVPLAIISSMHPNNSSYLVYLFLFTMFYPAFFFNTYYFFFGKKIKDINWKKVLNNVLLATIAALILVFVGLSTYVPDIATSILYMLGAMTIPLIMLVIGGNIYLDFNKRGEIFTIEIVKFLIVKNIIFPLIFLGILLFVKPPYHIALILIIQAAVPPVTSVPIFTERAGGNFSIVNQFVVSSFIFSLITLPVFITIFSWYFSP